MTTATTEEKKTACPFDFAAIKELIPEKGTLSVTFSKKGDLITMLFAAAFPGKEKDQAFRPIPVRATVEELTGKWGELQDLVAEMHRTATTTALGVRKAEVAKAASKTAQGKGAVKPAVAAPVPAEKKEASSSGSLFDTPPAAETDKDSSHPETAAPAGSGMPPAEEGEEEGEEPAESQEGGDHE